MEKSHWSHPDAGWCFSLCMCVMFVSCQPFSGPGRFSENCWCVAFMFCIRLRRPQRILHPVAAGKWAVSPWRRASSIGSWDICDLCLTVLLMCLLRPACINESQFPLLISDVAINLPLSGPDPTLRLATTQEEETSSDSPSQHLTPRWQNGRDGCLTHAPEASTCWLSKTFQPHLHLVVQLSPLLSQIRAHF